MENNPLGMGLLGMLGGGGQQGGGGGISSMLSPFLNPLFFKSAQHNNPMLNPLFAQMMGWGGQGGGMTNPLMSLMQPMGLMQLLQQQGYQRPPTKPSV